ncbi:hypothetical protein LCGC14_0529090 [marine sediment metagenome]|uniref:Uncharacterized protein n=1 Tax=marine sediment metagenome TaxID=412755 RepID=A0A0F9RW92_9ZZZZ
MQPCPVCKDSEQPVRFKIGVLVWRDGSRLRVCSTRCASKARARAKTLKRLNPERETSSVRRHVAWQYRNAKKMPALT